MSRWLVKLKLKSPLHLGKTGIGMEAVESFARSDTLFGGLCHAWSAIYGKNAATDLLENFCAGKPPFKISSAFPFKGETFFLPRPLLPVKLPGDDIASISYAKDLNHLPFVSLEIFRQWVLGENVDVKSILPLKEKLATAAVYQRVPRVQLDRVTCASGLFHAGMTVFNADAGLYCLVDVVEKVMKDKLEGAFAWLGDSGLGGMRSLGCGRFEPEWVQPGDEWSAIWHFNSNAAAWCLLSLTHPEREERSMPLEGANYEIVTRDGWASSPFTIRQVRRKSCKMFVEGTILPYEPKGCMVNVSPAGWDSGLHPLYRYGYALALPVEVKS